MHQGKKSAAFFFSFSTSFCIILIPSRFQQECLWAHLCAHVWCLNLRVMDKQSNVTERKRRSCREWQATAHMFSGAVNLRDDSADVWRSTRGGISITPRYGRQMTLWEEQRAACLTVKRAKCQWRRRRGSCCAVVTAARPQRGVESLIKLAAEKLRSVTVAVRREESGHSRRRSHHALHTVPTSPIAAPSPLFSPFCFSSLHLVLPRLLRKPFL